VDELGMDVDVVGEDEWMRFEEEDADADAEVEGGEEEEEVGGGAINEGTNNCVLIGYVELGLASVAGLRSYFQNNY
jgi:hypothetical protein